MKKEELLKKAIPLSTMDKSPVLSGVFIIQQRQLHDSGYRMMYVIGHTDYDEKLKDFKYYLIGTYSDVVEFTYDILNNFRKKISNIKMDINKNGIIHLWSSRDKFVCSCINVSSCVLEIVGD